MTRSVRSSPVATAGGPSSATAAFIARTSPSPKTPPSDFTMLTATPANASATASRITPGFTRAMRTASTSERRAAR